MPWNPTQYARFREQRAQPFHDLLALVRREAGMRVVDLGCGPGELTLLLHGELAAAETIGVDSSPEMLARSATHAAPGLSFVRADIAAFTGERRFDLVFSNAALQWLPDHPALFARLREMLVPGGQLAVQMPANFDHPSHTLAAEVAAEEPFRAALDGYARTFPVLPPEEYALLLHHLGFRQPLVRLQVYLHLLESREQVVEWVKGTLLTDYQGRLAPDLYARFLDRYRERLMPALSAERPYPYPFKRILLHATL